MNFLSSATQPSLFPNWSFSGAPTLSDGPSSLPFGADSLDLSGDESEPGGDGAQLSQMLDMSLMMGLMLGAMGSGQGMPALGGQFPGSFGSPFESMLNPPSPPWNNPSPQPAPSSTVSPSQQSYQNFQRQYQKDFKSWDAMSGNKGSLTSADLDHLMQDPNIKGRDAAALASVKELSDKAAKAGTTLQFGPQGATATPTGGGASNPNYFQQNAASIGNSYAANQKTINTSSHQLFTHGLPNYKAIKQGSIGDCYFDSSLAGLAKSHPQAVKNMIHNNQNGTYTVNFPGAHPVTVKAPTDAELAAYGGSGEDGMWASVMQKAYGEGRTQSGTLSPKDPDKNGIEPYEGANGGDHPANAIQALTGHAATLYPLNNPPSDLPQTIQTALQQGRLVEVGTHHSASGSDQEHEADGLPFNHALTVLGVNPQAGTITIRNPWGNNGANGSYAPTDGWTDGSNNGIFTMSMQNFYKDFSGVTIEEPI